MKIIPFDMIKAFLLLFNVLMVHETQGAMVCWDRTSLFLIE
jgi:hypothetical protein